MTQLGERLRAAREARGMSLADAASATRILPRYLLALEEGDLDRLPGDVYARGFIRNYAQLLGLPAEELILLYRQERGEPTGKIKVVPATAPPRMRGRWIPSISFFGSFFVIVVLVALLYFVAEGIGLFKQQPQVATNATPTRRIATATTFPTSTSLPSGITATAFPTVPTTSSTGIVGPPVTVVPTSVTPSATPGPSPTPTVPGQIVVAVSALPQTTGSWLEVRLDGSPQPKFNQLLVANLSPQQFTSQREIYINIGDTSAVQLTVNGQSCPGFPGTVRGRPRRVTINTAACPPAQ